MKSLTIDDTSRLKKIIDRLSPEDGKYICRFIYRDPFKGVYLKLLLIYVLILGGFLLWPFDLTFFVKNDIRWIENPTGVEFIKIGQVISDSSNQKFFDSLVKGEGLTLELWLLTEDMYQSGPARILSYSKNPELRNFTLGQSQNALIMRLRTTKTSLNGTNPRLIINDVFNYKGLQHLVIVYDFIKYRVFINGEKRVISNILKGNFSNWDPSCKLVIGNEVTGDRPWKGKIYYVAVYNRPMTEQEIRRNYFSGLDLKTITRPPVLWRKESMKHDEFKSINPVVRYLFDERKGDVIHDSGSGLNAVNLFIPYHIQFKMKPFLGVSTDYLQNNTKYTDIIINILIFIPLGILIHGVLRTRCGLTLKISLLTVLAGTLYSLGAETLQHFSSVRNSSLIDVATNMTGTAMGIVMDRCYYLFLNVQAKHLWTQINTDYQDS